MSSRFCWVRSKVLKCSSVTTLFKSLMMVVANNENFGSLFRNSRPYLGIVNS